MGFMCSSERKEKKITFFAFFGLFEVILYVLFNNVSVKVGHSSGLNQ